MKKFICLECGGNLELNNDLTMGKCPYCLTEWLLKEPLNDESFFKYQIATEYQKTFKFSDAKRNFEDVARQNPDFSEAWWGAFLAEYGIEFGLNRIGERVPTCHRTNTQSVFDSINYQNAIKYADIKNIERYNNEAKKIEDVRFSILQQVDDGKNYDVFICFKATEVDDPARRTIDYEFGTSIYENLTKQGYNVFFSPKTLLRVAEQNFEPYIYKALSTAKVMLLLCSNNKKIDSAWVKNEWSRYFDMYGGKGLIPICGNRLEPYSPSSLPYELQRLNAIIYDENVLENISIKVDSFFEDRKKEKEEKLKEKETEKQNAILEENERIKKELEEIKKSILNANKPQQTVSMPSGYNVEGAIKRCYNLINSRSFIDASELAENSLLFDGNNANFYLIKFLAKNSAQSLESLNNIEVFYEDDENFLTALKLADNTLKDKIKDFERKFLEEIIKSLHEFAENAVISGTTLQSFKVSKSTTKHIILTDNITDIGVRAFEQLLAEPTVKTLTIPQSVKKINELAFVGNKIQNIYLPNSIKNFDSKMFYANSNRGSVLNFETPKNLINNINLGDAGRFSVTGYTSTMYYAYTANYNTTSPIIKKRDFILNNFEDLKQYYENENKIINRKLQERKKLQEEKERQEKEALINESIPKIEEIFKYRKEFIDKATIINGVLEEYNLDYEKDEVVYMTENVKAIKPNLMDCHKNLKVFLSPNIKVLPKKSFVNQQRIEIYIPKTIETIETEAISTYMYKNAKSVIVNCEETSYKAGYKADWVFIAPYVQEKPICKKNGYIRNDFEYYKGINPELFNECLRKENKYIAERNAKKQEEERLKQEEERKKQEKLEKLKNQGFVINNETELYEYTGNSKKVEIPSFITKICAGAFRNNTSICEVIIPNSVVDIGQNAFNGCTSLQKIDIPNSVESLGASSFENCTSLKWVEFSNKLDYINSFVFKNCTSLKTLTFESVSDIYANAFENCNSLEEITFKSVVSRIYSKAFFGCSKTLKIYFREGTSTVNYWSKDWNVISLNFIGIPKKIKPSE